LTERVFVNVGIIRENDSGQLQIVRGSKLPVPKQANASLILELAEKKTYKSGPVFLW